MRALRDIQRGEELLHNYFGNDTDCKDKIHYLIVYGFMNDESDFEIKLQVDLSDQFPIYNLKNQLLGQQGKKSFVMSLN